MRKRWALRYYDPAGVVRVERRYWFRWDARNVLRWHTALVRPRPGDGWQLRLERVRNP